MSFQNHFSYQNDPTRFEIRENPAVPEDRIVYADRIIYVANYHKFVFAIEKDFDKALQISVAYAKNKLARHINARANLIRHMNMYFHHKSIVHIVSGHDNG